MATQIATTTEMFLQVGRRRWQVASLQEASEKFCAARDSMGLGASRMPLADIVDQNGAHLFYISYNGRVWHGRRTEWKPGQEPAYDNRTADVFA